MQFKFPTHVFVIYGANGQPEFHTDLGSALSPGGRTVAVYALQKVKSGRLVAEWDPDPIPKPEPPKPIREEING